MEKPKVLIADDEPDIIEFLSYNLDKEGFEVYSAENGTQALAIARSQRPQIILLDIMMPDMDGVEVCRMLREDRSFDSTAIVFLTARSEDYSQIAGFDAGADDYITKPVRPRVLTVRLKSLLKRSFAKDEPQESITIGQVSLNKENHSVIVSGQNYNLPKKEFEILYLLMSKPGKVYTREEIYRKVWGYDVYVGDRTIDVHVRKIREKIGNDFISTVKGIGYKFSEGALA
jgi:two-component system, OmpR family, alkaline phosphatase synthesis response regulator PhoP